MLDNGTGGKSHLHTEIFPLAASDRGAIVQDTALPLPPAMPEAVMRLQLLASSHGVDLHTLTDVVRNDIGLTVQLLHIAALEVSSRSSKSANISELIVHLGLDRLRQLAETTDIVSFPMGSLKARRWQLYCVQARSLGRLTEELAWQASSTDANVAFVAGLLRHLGSLPSLLGWDSSAEDAEDEGETGCQLLETWGLPPILADVVRGGANDSSSQRSRSLLSLVEAAEQQTWRPDAAARMSPVPAVR